MAVHVSSLSDTYDLVKRYVKQETVEPLRGAGRWLLFGLLAACALVLSSLFLLLGLLRLLQSQSLPFTGGWSFVPYVAVAGVAGLLSVFSLSRINKSSLNIQGSHV